MIRKIFVSLMFVSLMFLVSCGGSGGGSDGGGGGGGGTAPTILSLKDASGATIDATALVNSPGTTTTNPSYFTITFDQAMDIASLSGITLTCTPSGGTVMSATLVPAETSTAGAYTLAVTDAWKYALLSCVMTIPTTVTNSSGTAIATAATYTFTNPCAVSDDFNAQSISDVSSTCWQISTGGTITLATWAVMNGIIGIDPVNSIISSDFTGNSSNRANFYKTVSVGGDFEVIIHFKSASGINGADGPYAFATITDVPNFPPGNVNKNIYGVGIMGGGGVQYCIAVGQAVGFDPVFYGAQCDEDQVYYIKLAKSGNTFTRQYKIDGGEYQDMPQAGQGTWPDIDLSGGNWYLVLGYNSVAGGSEMSSIDSVYVNGITVSGQY